MFDPRRASPDSPVDSAMFPPVYNRSTSASSTASSVPDTAVKTETADRPRAVRMQPLPSLFGTQSAKHEASSASMASGSAPSDNASSSSSGKRTFMSELEPFEYRPSGAARPAVRQQSLAPAAPTSLSSVFGDQDLVDAIMFSLDIEQSATSATSDTGAATTFVMPRRTALSGFVQPPQMHMHMSMPMQMPLQHPQQAQPADSMLPRRLHGAGMASNRVKTVASVPCIRKPGTFLNKDGRWIKGKPCRMDGCDKRAQSNGLCKGHGGGARCSFAGCCKSSQGGGFCRAHGGGKRCLHEGCEKGTQRNGFCYLHGGVRSCSVEGCDKKDRGNGKCFSHGGGRKCQANLCFNTIRRGAFCDEHNVKAAK